MRGVFRRMSNAENIRMKIKKRNFRPVIIIFGIYLTAYLSIFRADFNYLDDLGRKHTGYHGWLDWSRWFTQIVSNFVHADLYLADISPLPQMIACFLMAAGSWILLLTFKKEKTVRLGNILAASLVGVTPYFLGIISYKYDSPYMAFSFFISTVPFLLYKKSKILYVLGSLICLILMCTSYQASSGVYPLVVLFLAGHEWNTEGKMRERIEFIGCSAFSYILALGTYWVLLMRPNGVSTLSWDHFLTGVIQKYTSFYSKVKTDFKVIWLVLIVLLVLLFLISFIAESRANKIFSGIVGLVMAVLGSAMTFGMYLIINLEKYDARAMYAFGVYLALLAISISFSDIHYSVRYIYLFLFWCFFTFSFAYGNALSSQKTYLDYRVLLVADDLNSLDVMKKDGKKRVQINGDIGLAPVIQNMSSGYRMLERLIPTGMGEGYWGGYYLLHYFNIPNVEQGDGMNAEEMELVCDSMYHTIYGEGNNILVVLKQ